MPNAQLTVIIPTLADSKRSESLLRAISSVVEQKEISLQIVVVVNGQRFDPALLSVLESRPDLQVMKLTPPSLSNAIYHGRVAVTTPFFSFLDDDDEYLPSSICRRMEKILKHPECVMVASTGIRDINGLRTPSAFNLVRAQQNPFHELAINNWMTSCGAIFRSSFATSEIFRNVPSHYEWTFLAYKLLLVGPFCIVEEPCYIIHDTPNSLSKSTAYFEANADVLREILKIDLPAEVARSVKSRLSRAEHDLAYGAISKGLRLKAFKHHFRSLFLPGGLRYVFFTRHLLKFSTQRDVVP